MATEPTPEDLAQWVEREGSPVDPYPDLPVIAREELRDGDVLLMLGTGTAHVDPIPFPIPVSWIIRKLDGGAYSHAAIVTWEPPEPGAPREPRVWDHSVDWKLGPVPVDDALHEHAWCHVYRFEKEGEPLGSARFPRERVPEALRPHAGEPYDMQLLVFSGIVALLSRVPENPRLRAALRFALDQVVKALAWYLDHRDIGTGAFVCTGVPGISFWQALEEVPHDYALEVDVQRRRVQAPEPDPGWEETMEHLREVLRRIYPDFDPQLAAWRRTLAGNALWVPVGSEGLPVNLVSPSDLEFSRTLKRRAKLAIPTSR